MSIIASLLPSSLLDFFSRRKCVQSTIFPHYLEDLPSIDGLGTEKLAPESHEFALSDCVTDARLMKFGLTVVPSRHCTISDIAFSRTIGWIQYMFPFTCEKLFRRDVDIGEWVNDCRHFLLENLCIWS
jgi:hypothetical protein